MTQYNIATVMSALLQGVRTFVVTNHDTNASHYMATPVQEWYDSYQDDADGSRRTYHKADTRDALAPFLAYKYLKAGGHTFKWLFTGPAATTFFLGGAQKAVAGLDANQPYVLSGAFSCRCALPQYCKC